jgi:hypothetical protein
VVTVISDTGKLDWLKGGCEVKLMEIASMHYNVTSFGFIPYKLLLAWYDSLTHFPCHSTQPISPSKRHYVPSVVYIAP